MADTQRTASALTTLLADNSTGNINEQDLRDVLVSLQPDTGQIYEQSNATATTVAAGSTWYEVTLSGTALTSGARNFDSPASGQLRYTGTPDRVFLIVANFSVSSGSANQALEFGIGLDGTIDATSVIITDSGAISTDRAMSLSFLITLSTNEYVSLMVQNTTGANDVTVSDLTMQAIGMLS